MNTETQVGQTSAVKEAKEVRLVLATKHEKALLRAREILKMPFLERRDPEKPHWRVSYEQESSSDSAVQVVLQKIQRVREGLDQEDFLQEDLLFLASDIGFYLNQEQKHQIIRSPEDKIRFANEPWELDRERLRVVEEYSQPFEARWRVTFVVSDPAGDTFVAEAFIRSVSEGFPKDEIYNNFFPRANTGLKLVEMLQKTGGQFEIVFRDQEQGFVDTPQVISGEEAYQFIVDKIPPPEILFVNPADRQSLGIFTIALVAAEGDVGPLS